MTEPQQNAEDAKLDRRNQERRRVATEFAEHAEEDPGANQPSAYPCSAVHFFSEKLSRLASILGRWGSRGGRRILRVLCVTLRSLTSFVPLLAVLLFLGALFWAKGRDPFSRKWFTLKTSSHGSVKCVAVLPKPAGRYPLVIYAHGSGGTLMNDGSELRQMAELGLATVSLDYDQSNEVAFIAQFEALLHHLGGQEWANTNAVAWVGFSLGANRMLEFALEHPEQQPQLLVQLSGAGLPEGQTSNRLGLLHCPVLLIHGRQDEVFPVADTKRLAMVLETSGLPTELRIIPGASHGMEPERGVVFRGIGEYCLSQLSGREALANYRSISLWQSSAWPLWVFWLPAMAWAGVWGWWRAVVRRGIAAKRREETGGAGLSWLRWVAGILAAVALGQTALHLVPPQLPVGEGALALARKYLVQPKQGRDFEFLTSRPIWRGQRLKALLDHVELAGYNRELINWQLEEKTYQDYVLSPGITGDAAEQVNWRRLLWEGFYPRIRHELSPQNAAGIVVRHLRERVTIAAGPNLPHDVPAIWLRQITDASGFEIIYVAALRSVGVPARLDRRGRAELLANDKWQFAPRPSVTSFLQSEPPDQ
jgi:pimeloyl-ACP methyl ester carboxylesterase